MVSNVVVRGCRFVKCSLEIKMRTHCEHVQDEMIGCTMKKKRKKKRRRERRKGRERYIYVFIHIYKQTGAGPASVVTNGEMWFDICLDWLLRRRRSSSNDTFQEPKPSGKHCQFKITPVRKFSPQIQTNTTKEKYLPPLPCINYHPHLNSSHSGSTTPLGTTSHRIPQPLHLLLSSSTANPLTAPFNPSTKSPISTSLTTRLQP